METAQDLFSPLRHPRNTVFFSENHFSELKNMMQEKQIAKGTWLFLEGDAADKLYFLKEGDLKLVKTTDDGRELVLYHFRPGDLLGELEGGDVKNCSFSAKAVRNCTIGVIRFRDLEVLLQKDGNMAVEFIKWMTHLQRFTQFKLRDLLFYGKNGALASTLIRMTNTYGIMDGETIHFSANFTNGELAQMIGSTRETVNRMLQQLKKTGIINYEQGSIVIKNLDGLKEICHCEGCPVEICRL